VRQWLRRLRGFRVDRALNVVWQAAGRWTLLTTLLLFLQALLLVVTLFLFKAIVDELTRPVAEIMSGQVMLLIGIALGVALLNILGGVLVGYGSTLQAHLVADHIQGLVQAQSIKLDLAYYENAQFFDQLHRAQREAPTRPVRIVQGLNELTRHGLTLLLAAVVLVNFHWLLVLGFFLAALPVLVFRMLQAEAVYQWHRDKTANERLGNFFNEVITTAAYAKEVRSFGFGPSFIERFNVLRQRIRQGLQRVTAHGYRRQFVTEAFAVLAGFGALAVIAYAAVQQTITVGELVLYFGAFQVMLMALRPSLAALAQVYENNIFLSTLDEFLAVPQQVPEPAQPRSLPLTWNRGLLLSDVGFRYPGTASLVLDGVNLRIAPGEIVALVGRNGSGKTTLTKLLGRLYDPDQGCITLEGIDLREFNSADLRRRISVIYQDFGRYPMTARENIALGNPLLAPDAPAIVAAAQRAGIHADLLRLPNGYETVLGRRLADGAELSIGQWQKLALARAFVRDAELILLDEPTSALDAAAEHDFFVRFRELVTGRAALIISHRFSTVGLADRIYVLDQGRMVEQGRHRDLLALDGLYAQLYRQQAAFYLSDSRFDAGTLAPASPSLRRSNP
jgi:ATP-binding cassette, subfamily B, bacterial